MRLEKHPGGGGNIERCGGIKRFHIFVFFVFLLFLFKFCLNRTLLAGWYFDRGIIRCYYFFGTFFIGVLLFPSYFLHKGFLVLVLSFFAFADIEKRVTSNEYRDTKRFYSLISWN